MDDTASADLANKIADSYTSSVKKGKRKSRRRKISENFPFSFSHRRGMPLVFGIICLKIVIAHSAPSDPYRARVPHNGPGTKPWASKGRFQLLKFQ